MSAKNTTFAAKFNKILPIKDTKKTAKKQSFSVSCRKVSEFQGLKQRRVKQPEGCETFQLLEQHCRCT